jgi:hypothetical protein
MPTWRKNHLQQQGQEVFNCGNTKENREEVFNRSSTTNDDERQFLLSPRS